MILDNSRIKERLKAKRVSFNKAPHEVVQDGCDTSP